MKKEKNEKIINVGEKLAKNIKITRIIEKRIPKKKENFGIIMFDVVDVKKSNAKTFIKYYIDDTTTISDSFTKFCFKFENFLKKKGAAQTHEKEKNSKK